MRTASLLLPLLLLAGRAQAAALSRGPYLESMGASDVTVRFRTDIDTVAWLSYGAAPDCERFLTPAGPGIEHRVQLYGLLPDTTHCYRIYLPVEQSTCDYQAYQGTFVTFPDEDKPDFSFLAFGGSGSGSQDQRDLAAQMDKFTPDFVLHTGDMLSSGRDSEADDEFFAPYSSMLARVPFFPTLGLSDYGPGYDKPAGREFLRYNYLPFHSVPYTGLYPHYYYFDIGNARFVVLDANSFAGARYAPALRPGLKQYKWLEFVLSRARDKAWKFVVLNEPLYSTGSEPREDEIKTLEPLFQKYGVDLVLQGRDRDYERTVPLKDGAPDQVAGITYVTLGGGGMSLGVEQRTEPWSAKFLPEYTFALFAVRDRDLKMTVYDKSGEVVDTLEIQK